MQDTNPEGIRASGNPISQDPQIDIWVARKAEAASFIEKEKPAMEQAMAAYLVAKGLTATAPKWLCPRLVLDGNEWRLEWETLDGVQPANLPEWLQGLDLTLYNWRLIGTVRKQDGGFVLSRKKRGVAL